MFVTILVAELPSTTSGFYSNQLRKEPLDAFDAAAKQLWPCIGWCVGTWDPHPANQERPGSPGRNDAPVCRQPANFTSKQDGYKSKALWSSISHAQKHVHSVLCTPYGQLSFPGLNPTPSWSSDPLESICLHDGCLTDGAGPFIDTRGSCIGWADCGIPRQAWLLGLFAARFPRAPKAIVCRRAFASRNHQEPRKCWRICLAWLVACLENLVIASTMTSSENTSSEKRVDADATPKKLCSSSLNPGIQIHLKHLTLRIGLQCFDRPWLMTSASYSSGKLAPFITSLKQACS